MKKLLVTFLVACCLVSCGNDGKGSDPLADSGRTERTENLRENLRDIVTEKGFLVGQQDATLYGIGWRYEQERSDIYSVCNEMPAVVGFNITGYAANDSLSSDSVEFSRIREAAIAQYDKGGMVEMQGYAADVKFLNTLVTPYGIKVPVVFFVKDDVAKAVEEIKANEVTNALIAAEADGENVDVLTASFSFTPEKEDSVSLLDEAKQLEQKLQSLQSSAKKANKPYALSAVSYKGLRYSEFWTHTLLPVLEKFSLSYILFSSNANGEEHDFSTPYPGQISSTDFVRFYNNPKTLFLKETPALYTNIKAFREEQKKSAN